MPNSQEKRCLFCRTPAPSEKTLDNLTVTYHCPNCGDYSVFGVANSEMDQILCEDFPGKAHIISGLVKEMNDAGEQIPTITPDNMDSIFDFNRAPRNMLEKLDRALLYFHKRTTFLYERIHSTTIPPACFYALNVEERNSILSALSKKEYVEFVGPPLRQNDRVERDFFLTVDGLAHVEELLRTRPRQRRCFVAMWFTYISNIRLKRSGAWWYAVKANEMLALRCAVYNGTYDRVFQEYKDHTLARQTKLNS